MCAQKSYRARNFGGNEAVFEFEKELDEKRADYILIL